MTLSTLFKIKLLLIAGEIFTKQRSETDRACRYKSVQSGKVELLLP